MTIDWETIKDRFTRSYDVWISYSIKNMKMTSYGTTYRQFTLFFLDNNIVCGRCETEYDEELCIYKAFNLLEKRLNGVGV